MAIALLRLSSVRFASTVFLRSLDRSLGSKYSEALDTSSLFFSGDEDRLSVRAIPAIVVSLPSVCFGESRASTPAAGIADLAARAAAAAAAAAALAADACAAAAAAAFFLSFSALAAAAAAAAAAAFFCAFFFSFLRFFFSGWACLSRARSARFASFSLRSISHRVFITSRRSIRLKISVSRSFSDSPFSRARSSSSPMRFSS
uniref:Putative ice-structuring protein 4 n=1 Tax=Anopheles triannulatus TaxID=58253 RepID=A0A2M4AML9_9DIPT